MWRMVSVQGHPPEVINQYEGDERSPFGPCCEATGSSDGHMVPITRGSSLRPGDPNRTGSASPCTPVDLFSTSAFISFAFAWRSSAVVLARPETRARRGNRPALLVRF